MFAVRCVANPAVQCVTHRANHRANSRHVQHQWDVILFQVIVQLLVRHARFKQCGTTVNIDFDNFVHLAQI
ncbi:hypothetical protein D3C85_1888380 [compost metagenome]